MMETIRHRHQYKLLTAGFTLPRDHSEAAGLRLKIPELAGMS